MSPRISEGRLLWGVLFSSHSPVERKREPMLLWEAWCPKRYSPDHITHIRATRMPRRVLLFERRRDARAWCRDARQRFAYLKLGWRFTPVRVRETVRAA